MCENSKVGTDPSVWRISGAGDLTIQGFATNISVNKGGTIRYKINTPASNYHLDIYRLGYYGGLGARMEASNIGVTLSLPQSQPACLTDSATGLIDCGNWAESASWAVPTTAVSGIYFALLTRLDTGGRSQIFFVVRDDASTSDLLFKTSDTTWQAYNKYGGNSLYTCSCAAGQAYKVSYNRPFVTANNGPNDWVFSVEAGMVSWIESNGYNVSYTSGLDVDRLGASLLKQHRVILSVGHDEYWSAGERANVEAARDAGVNLAFFSGNELFWKTRWEPSIDGTVTPYRTLVTYKETRAGGPIDPQDPPTWTGTWRDPRFSPPADGGRPENALTGTIFMVDPGASNSILVPAADGKMRFWRNTSVANLAAGTTATLAANTLGYEWDEDLDNGFRPPGLFDLSTSTYSVPALLADYGLNEGPGTATHHLTLYRAPSGALVFGAGTVQWGWGLSGSPDGSVGADIRMEQATVNLLADMGVQPRTLRSGLVKATKSIDTIPPTSTITSPTSGASFQAGTSVTIKGAATDVNGKVAGVEVSTDGGTTWHPASGRRSWTYSWIAGGSPSTTIRSRAVDDSGNLERPAAGITVSVACPCAIWSTSATPVTPSENDASAIEVGVKFRSEVDISVSAIRFYKGAGNTGTHLGHLWTSSGQLLAAATFSNETGSGWQQVNLPTPVALSFGVTYVASYFAPAGHYSDTASYFYPLPAPPGANGFGNGTPPLHAIQSGVDGPNGVFLYSGSGGFPTGSNNATNYWVDIVATPISGPDTMPAVVTVTVPNTGATGVTASTSLSATFNEAINPGSISFVVKDPLGNSVPGTVSYTSATNTAGFQPGSALGSGTTYVAAVQATDTDGNAITSPYTWSFAVAGIKACPCSIWSYTTQPSVADSGDSASVELGVKFRTDISGYVTGIRFYKSSSNIGIHIGNLWTSGGTLLASARFANESASGWEQVTFPDGGVPVTAGTTYIASYFAPAGHYAFTQSGLSGGVDNAPLHALADGLDGPNGVYSYSTTTTFPSGSFNASNYWVDVVFNTTGTADTAPPKVTAVTPASGATGVVYTTPATATFNEAVQSSSISFQLRDSGGNLVAGSASYDPSSYTVTFNPAAQLLVSATYSASVSASDLAGNAMTAPFTWSFTTAAPSCPCTIWPPSATPTVADAADSSSVEVGVKFRTEITGFIIGVRFYKGIQNTGTHIGNLWMSTGSLLATATFTNETASGWQQVTFSQPVAVTANTTYVASYFAPAGEYAADHSYFASTGANNPPLHALANGVDGSNGVYSYGGTSSFPTSSYSATNYWVDVVFTTN